VVARIRESLIFNLLYSPEPYPASRH